MRAKGTGTSKLTPAASTKVTDRQNNKFRSRNKSTDASSKTESSKVNDSPVSDKETITLTATARTKGAERQRKWRARNKSTAASRTKEAERKRKCRARTKSTAASSTEEAERKRKCQSKYQASTKGKSCKKRYRASTKGRHSRVNENLRRCLRRRQSVAQEHGEYFANKHLFATFAAASLAEDTSAHVSITKEQYMNLLQPLSDEEVVNIKKKWDEHMKKGTDGRICATCGIVGLINCKWYPLHSHAINAFAVEPGDGTQAGEALKYLAKADNPKGRSIAGEHPPLNLVRKYVFTYYDQQYPDYTQYKLSAIPTSWYTPNPNPHTQTLSLSLILHSPSHTHTPWK